MPFMGKMDKKMFSFFLVKKNDFQSSVFLPYNSKFKTNLEHFFNTIIVSENNDLWQHSLFRGLELFFNVLKG